ncbi:MAG TPA: phosphoribosylformylglycinamidine synthase subunit PurQ [Candidatus Peribacteraceae bacterium]|nr:phosphoribosylformylglycinamidine synthase subunit PurQ [Candidatus Peribacteraceae bacterium]
MAIISFPGNNCEVESIRAIKAAGMEPLFFRWNDSREKLAGVDGYFIIGGFSYEDRGRAGMVAARDPLLAHIAAEAALGKVVIGNCNGAQILVESGLIPLGSGLRMSLARNALRGQAVGFRNEWVWIKPTCAADRCATSNWQGTMHLPIAHGEGRYVTKNPEVIAELQKNDQIAFCYCTEGGEIRSDDPAVTPNGATLGIAGICNPAGNVVVLMPHPERTDNGAPYFKALRQWIESKKVKPYLQPTLEVLNRTLPKRKAREVEIFIDTIIVNNEERTVEQAAHRIVPKLRLRQLRYLAPANGDAESILRKISLFNPNKEIAFIRRGSTLTRWNNDRKTEEPAESFLGNLALLRRDEPDTGASALGPGSETGVCYVCSGITEQEAQRNDLQEIFANPHASTLERLS